MRILVGIDGTDRSLAALRFVTRLLSTDRDEIILFFAPPQRRWGSHWPVPPERQAETVEAFTTSVFRDAESQLPAGIAHRRMLPEAEQNAGRAVIEAARQSASSIIAVGAGRSSSRLRFFVGGVARRVIHQAECPVLAYRPPAEQLDGCGDGPLRVLLAVDPTDSFESIVSLLGQFCWPAGSQGDLIHVVDYVEDERLRHWINTETLDDSATWNDALDRELHDERERVAGQLQQLTTRLPVIFHGREPLLRVGHVVEQIVQTVDSESYDLVVVGGRRRGLVSRWLGSTTEGLLLQANASILVIHEPDEA